MTARILLIRHAAHDLLGKVLCGRMDGVGLNEAGEAQAARLGGQLQGERLTAVYASPLLRARQTADAVATACGLATQVTGALDEIDFGAWTGLTFDALASQPQWHRWNADRLHHQPPGGECMVAVQMRIAVWLREMAAAHGGETIAAVSHADVIKAACCHVLGLSIDAFGRFDIDPASVTTVSAGDWGFKLVRMNQG